MVKIRFKCFPGVEREMEQSKLLQQSESDEKAMNIEKSSVQTLHPIRRPLSCKDLLSTEPGIERWNRADPTVHQWLNCLKDSLVFSGSRIRRFEPAIIYHLPRYLFFWRTGGRSS